MFVVGGSGGLSQTMRGETVRWVGSQKKQLLLGVVELMAATAAGAGAGAARDKLVRRRMKRLERKGKERRRSESMVVGG